MKTNWISWILLILIQLFRVVIRREEQQLISKKAHLRDKLTIKTKIKTMLKTKTITKIMQIRCKDLNSNKIEVQERIIKIQIEIKDNNKTKTPWETKKQVPPVKMTISIKVKFKSKAQLGNRDKCKITKVGISSNRAIRIHHGIRRTLKVKGNHQIRWQVTIKDNCQAQCKIKK